MSEITTSFGDVLQRLNASLLLKDIRWKAYVLATIRHETANTFQPIKEYGSEAYLKSKPYYPYIGRGYVQLTWRSNYEKFGKLLGIDLVNNMEMACEPEIAWRILELGMTKGLFTGKKLSDYFNAERTWWKSARRIINGLDKCELIAEYGKDYFYKLSNS